MLMLLLLWSHGTSLEISKGFHFKAAAAVRGTVTLLMEEVPVHQPGPVPTLVCPSRLTFGFKYMELASPNIDGKTSEEAQSASVVTVRTQPAGIQEYIRHLLTTSSARERYNKSPRCESLFVLVRKENDCGEWDLVCSAPRATVLDLFPRTASMIACVIFVLLYFICIFLSSLSIRGTGPVHSVCIPTHLTLLLEYCLVCSITVYTGPNCSNTIITTEPGAIRYVSLLVNCVYVIGTALLGS